MRITIYNCKNYFKKFMLMFSLFPFSFYILIEFRFNFSFSWTRRMNFYCNSSRAMHMYKAFLLTLTWWHGYAVSLGVQETADLSKVTVPLDYVFDGGGFHQERVTAFPLDHSFHALNVACRKYRRLRRVHEGPHALVRREIGILDHAENFVVEYACR